jgi:hypothetical protein
LNGFRIALGRLVILVLALVSAFLLGGLMIAVTDFDHLKSIGSDPFGAVGGARSTR